MSGVELVNRCNTNLVIVIGVPLVLCVWLLLRETSQTAEMEGEFSFPVKAGVTGLHLGSEPPELGEWSAPRFSLGWAELCLCVR